MKAPHSDSLTPGALRLIRATAPNYEVRLAGTIEELHAIQALRFGVFNLELNEGLKDSFRTGRDEDPFDAVCDHLLVEHTPTGEVVGTYRVQSGLKAATHLGYYSAQEFDLSPFDHHRSEVIELGRACVHRGHRNLVVLGLLWNGIGQYASACGGRYLLGCSSINSQDEALGASAYTEIFRKHLAPPAWRTTAWPACECSLDQLAEGAPPLPKLLRAYLSLGAKICAPPAIDRQFGTIDLLTWLDLESLPASVRARVGLPVV